MKEILTEWRKFVNEADDFGWDEFGFSDEERGESKGYPPHYEDLVGLERGDTFTIGNRKPVYYVVGGPLDKGKAKGAQTKIVVKYDPSGTSPEDAAEAAAKKRKTYEIRTTGDDYEVGAFGKDEDNEHTVLIGKTGFVMNITKVSKDI